MKVAIYIEQGITQLVLTPEGEWESGVVSKMASDGAYDVQIHRGSFYGCVGGWKRYTPADPFGNKRDESLILRASPRSPSTPDTP